MEGFDARCERGGQHLIKFQYSWNAVVLCLCDCCSDGSTVIYGSVGRLP